MNSLHIGLADKHFETGSLLIDDNPIGGKLFDPTIHSFNPLRGIDYKRAREFAEIVYTASPQGENTLTVRNGKRALTRLLLTTTRLDRLPEPPKDDLGAIEAKATIDDLLLSPVLRKVLCNPTNFSFKGSVSARINRAELGDFDAFILGTLLIGQTKGQVVVPDGGFYLRDFHTSLIRQNRLALGVNYLAELPQKLRQAVLTIKDKRFYHLTREDAETLIFYTDTPTGNPSNLM